MFSALFMLLLHKADAQDRSITGTVISKNGETLIGVSILLKGTTRGVATDVNGNFKMNVPAKGAVLVVKYIGYKPQEINVGDQRTLSVTLLEDDAKLLNEVNVVNIGYGKVSKDAITGSVSSISSKDIRDYPVSTAAEALAGKLAGVTVTTTEGKPGADIQIRVRGGNSLTQDNSPLYIVDGVQVDNALSLISPAEIQSIDVLKDIASTAIYGARGSNGVVLITTKSGHEGRTTTSFSAYGGVRKISNELPVMNPYDFVLYQYQITNYNTTQLQKDAFTKSYGTYEDLDIYKNVPFRDWQKDVFGHAAQSYTQNLNINGGSKTSSFSFTLNNTKEDGIMLQSGIKRTFASFRYDTKASDQFRFGFNARYSRQQTDGVGTSSTGSQGNNYLRNSVRYRPFDGGSVASVDTFDPDYANLTNLVNPVLLANSLTQNAYKNDAILSGTASYNFTPNLVLQSIVGVTATDNRTNTFSGTATAVARQNANQPVAVIGTGTSLSIINTNTLNFNKTFAKYHNVNILVGEETNQTANKTLSVTTKYLPVDITAQQAFAGIQKAQVPNGLIQDAPSTSESGYRLFSLFGRASYDYKGKYLGTFNYRADASSLFATGQRIGYFPSGQLAWRLTEEDFVKRADLKWLDNAKLRVSYGAGGNNRIGVDLYKTLFASSGSYGYAQGEAITPGFASPNLANPYITWETTISRNLGVDLGLFRGRVTASVDIYNNSTHNLLLQANIPVTSGYSSQTQNIGKTSNQGIEIQLSGVIVNNKNFTYSANFNIAHNVNKIVSLGNDPYGNPISSYPTQSGWVNSLNDFMVAVGQPVGQFYGYVTDGRYEVSDFNAVLNSTTNTWTYTLKPGIANDGSVALGNKAPQPGDLKLKKLSGGTDMNISAADMTVLGTNQPKVTGGLSQTFQYKDLALTVGINYSYGAKEYNANTAEFTTNYNGYLDNNMLAVVANRWKMYDNQGVRVTDPTQLAAMNANTSFWTPTVGNYILTSYDIEDASYIRINNVSLSYSLPQKFLTRTHIFSRFRVYATVNNLYTITGYKGYDPEASTRRSNPLTPGVDYSAYPRSRYFSAGLDVSF
ncbi:TonB-linked SusC/RagA family outer membrane protein [Mucilaginibacter yixingensis]|uniref:TonB-linked SusC/RagA family outer membrane protein n=2 Tax=Mucilaginibacter yixingensis TaxID=1295612 RepID=A0A2T5J940_9SPHI|nr:TonB-linked SusC/RagA family outer membrane protein [Mucilaginibacter yixingensis]